tara:strand:+ start:316 stop:543 length:228 start_codon:yes stop_codon:yes gene_type:complete
MKKRYRKDKKGMEEALFDMGFKKIQILVYPLEECEKPFRMYIRNTDAPPKGNYIMVHVDGATEVFEMIDLDALPI